MSQIVISGYDIPIDIGSFRLQINNNFFIDEALQGSFSFPVKLPATDQVKSLLNWIESTENTKWDHDKVTYPCQYIDQGMTVFRGKIIIQRASNSMYDFSFAVGLTELDKIKDTSLRNIDMGGVVHVDIPRFQIWEISGTPAVGDHLDVVITKGILGDQYMPPSFILFNTSIHQTLLDVKAIIDAWQDSLETAGTGYLNHKGLRLNVEVVGDTIKFEVNQNDIEMWFSSKIYAHNFSGAWNATLIDYNTNADELEYNWKVHMSDCLMNEKNVMFVPVLNKKSGYSKQIPFSSPVDDDHIIQNNFDPKTGEYYTDYAGGSQAFNHRSLITPFPRAKYVLGQIMKSVKYTIDSGVFDTVMARNMLMWSSYSVAINKKRWRVAVQELDNSIVTYPFFFNKSYYDLQKVVPDRTVGDFLKALAAALCITFYPDHINRKLKAVANQEILSSTDIDNWSRYFIKNSASRSFDDQLSGITYDFSWDSSDGAKEIVCPTIDGKIILGTVNTVADLPNPPIKAADFGGGGNPPISSDTADVFLLSLYQAGVLYFVKDENAYYGAQLDNDPSTTDTLWNYFVGWKKYCDGLYPVATGDGSTSVSLPFDTLMNVIEEYYLSPTEKWKIPYVETGINFREPAFPLDMLQYTNEPNDFGIRFFFYRGLGKTTDGYDYPLSGWDSKDVNGTIINPSENIEDLAFSGDRGLMNNSYKLYNRIRLYGKPVEMLLDLPLDIIQKPNLWKKKHINGQNYIIKSIDVQLPLKGPCVVTAVKVPSMEATT